MDIHQPSNFPGDEPQMVIGENGKKVLRQEALDLKWNECFCCQYLFPPEMMTNEPRKTKDDTYGFFCEDCFYGNHFERCLD
jgi:hypothetical protein